MEIQDTMPSLLHILLVEDNAHDQIAFRRAMARMDTPVELTIEERAEAALTRLLENPSAFDLVVSDYKLPGMNGLEFCRKLLHHQMPLPIVLLTGTGSESLAVEALKAGVNDYIIKDPHNGYLELLPVVLSSVVRQYRHRLAHQRAEKALQESEARFRLLAEQAQDLIYRIQLAPEIQFEYVSPSATTITGYTPEDHYADPQLGFKLVHPDDHPILEAVSRSKTPYDAPIVLRWVKKDGSVIWTEQRNTPIYDETGNMVALEGIARDITERKRTEEALRQSEQKFRSVIEQSTDSIVMCDENGLIIEWNKAQEQLSGIQRAEALGRSLCELLIQMSPEEARTAEACAGVRAAMAQMLRTGQGHQGDQREEKEIVRPDGTRCTVETSMFPIRTESGFMIGSITRNITERKRTEEALRQSEQKFRSVIEQSSDSIVICDEAGLTIAWNHAQEQLSGIHRDEALGRPLRDLLIQMTPDEVMPPAAYEEIRAARRQLLKSDKDCRIDQREEREIIRPDGTRRTVETSLFPIQAESGLMIGSITRDITERKRVEAALRHARDELELRVQERTAELEAQYARLDAILHSVTDSIVVTEETGRIIEANPVAQSWLDQALSPADTERLREAVRDLAQSADQYPQTELELTGLDLELHAAPARVNDDEEPTAAVVCIHDVTHLKALSRMKTRFVENISHELRTPLSTIKAYAYLMQQQPGRWQFHLEHLTNEVDQLTRLVGDILEISRIDAGRIEISPQMTDLNWMTRSVISNYRAAAQDRGITIEYRPCDCQPMNRVDPNRMVQVLDKLINNAVRHTLPDGRVTITTNVAESDDRSWTTVTVADTGIGIPSDELPHIFDRFFRGAEPRAMQLTGTGLGLPIAQAIVELHGGRIGVESEAGAGSTFTVWLPLAEDGEKCRC